MAEEIKIQIGADSSQLTAELQAATNELKKLESQLKKASDVDSIKKLNTEIRYVKETIVSLQSEGAKLSNTLGGGLKKNTDKATQSLTDMSRVIQDAPYGFIGISNNINPLVESFQRLSAEAKLTGVSVGKQLISSLTGPAGLGIAFAAVTTAITFAQVGFAAWTRTAKASKDENEKYAESLKKAEQGAISQGLRLEGLTKIITNSTASEKDRNAALIEANSLLKPYGEKIDSINISVAKAKELTDAYTEALINQAVGAKIADKIADLRLKKTELLNKLEQQKSAIIAQQNKRLAEANSLTGRQYGTSDRAALQYLQTTTDIGVEQEKLVSINSDLVDVQKELNRYTDQYNVTVSKSLKTDKEKVKSTGETLPEALAKFERSLKAIQSVGLSLNTPQFNINADKIKEFESFLKKIIEKFNVDPKNTLYLGLETRVNKLKDANFFAAVKASAERTRKEAADILSIIPVDGVTIEFTKLKFNQAVIDKALKEGLIERIKKAAKDNGIVLPIGFENLNYEGILKLFDKISTDAKKLAEEKLASFKSIIVSFAQDAAAQIGELLGQGLYAAISGQTDGLRQAFAGLFNLFGDAVISLGKYAIAYSQAIVALKASIKAAGITGIGVGIGLIALGALIKAAAGGIGRAGAFAVGTRYAPGGMALVGERGPEMINLPRGSQVIPAAQTSQMMGGIGGAIEVFGMLRGQDIYFSNKKYSQTYKRTT